MSKLVKEMQIFDIRSRIGESREMLVIDAARLDAVATNKFRLGLREKSISAITVRNTLAKQALRQAGVTALEPFLQGPSTLVWGGEDIVALSKEITKWVKELKLLEIKGGTVEGSALSAADVDALSKSPSRDELIGQIAGMILGSGAELAAALLGPGGTLAGQVKSIADEDETE